MTVLQINQGLTPDKVNKLLKTQILTQMDSTMAIHQKRESSKPLENRQ